MVALLTALLAVQPWTVRSVPEGWKECPNGGQRRISEACPPTDPNPGYVYFDRNQHELSERARRTLDHFAEAMRYIHTRTNPNARLLVEAHVDPTEAETEDLSLSRRRAGAVRQYLLSRGCPLGVMDILLVGGVRPVAQGSDDQSQADNRRIVLLITGMRR